MGYDIGTTRSGLRLGFTTGSCAAGAAKAAAHMLFAGEEIRQVHLMTPKGIGLYLDVESIRRTEEYVECAVRKYSGDDPDVTDGLLVFARVEKTDTEPEEGNYFCESGTAPETEPEEEETSADVSSSGRAEQQTEYDAGRSTGRIFLDGGTGVGRVTRPGLEQQVGQAAINRVPRKMIADAVREICRRHHYEGNLKVLIFIPEGEKTAGRTFNPRLGIQGGLSVLGTTGIVEPMSEKALTDTIYLEMKMLRERGFSYCYVVPGNYGTDFLKDVLRLDPEQAVKCSNYVGETIDDARLLGMKGILLAGHIGKFVKLAAGVMNTHSRQADCRMEVLASHAAMAGADRETVRGIMRCINTSEAIEILRKERILDSEIARVCHGADPVLPGETGQEKNCRSEQSYFRGGRCAWEDGECGSSDSCGVQPEWRTVV